MMVLSCFFQELCEFVKHCNKRNIFLCLFSLLTITGRNEAIIWAIPWCRTYVSDTYFMPGALTGSEIYSKAKKKYMFVSDLLSF